MYNYLIPGDTVYLGTQKTIVGRVDIDLNAIITYGGIQINRTTGKGVHELVEITGVLTQIDRCILTGQGFTVDIPGKISFTVHSRNIPDTMPEKPVRPKRWRDMKVSMIKEEWNAHMELYHEEMEHWRKMRGLWIDERKVVRKLTRIRRMMFATLEGRAWR